MKSLNYLKWPLVIVFAGFVLQVIGAMLKILHWANIDTLIISSTLIILSGVAWLIIKILSVKTQ